MFLSKTNQFLIYKNIQKKKKKKKKIKIKIKNRIEKTSRK